MISDSGSESAVGSHQNSCSVVAISEVLIYRRSMNGWLIDAIDWRVAEPASQHTHSSSMAPMASWLTHVSITGCCRPSALHTTASVMRWWRHDGVWPLANKLMATTNPESWVRSGPGIRPSGGQLPAVKGDKINEINERKLTTAARVNFLTR